MNFGQPIPFWQNFLESNDVIFSTITVLFTPLSHFLRTNKNTPYEDSVSGILFSLTIFSSYSSSTLKFLWQQKFIEPSSPLIDLTPSTLGVTPTFSPGSRETFMPALLVSHWPIRSQKLVDSCWCRECPRIKQSTQRWFPFILFSVDLSFTESVLWHFLKAYNY